MRLIFTSPRHQNIDRVVELLGKHGIETKVTNRARYGGNEWKRFSYSRRETSDTWPQIWVVNSNDQTRARALLRETGLEPATRYADELAASRFPTFTSEVRHHTIAKRARLIALIVVFGAAIVLGLRGCMV